MVFQQLARKLISLNSSHGSQDAITFHSRGGIGNQLFIFFAALQLAEANNCHLVIDPSQHQFTPDLPFLLDQITAAFPQPARESIHLIDSPSNWISRERLKNSIPCNCSYNQPSFAYDSRIKTVGVGSCIFGYFQSWKFINQISDTSMNSLREAISQLSGGAEPPLWSSKDIVLHVRRGDFLKPEVRKIHGVLGLDYYFAAINKMQEMGASGAVWVISEEPIKDMDIIEDSLGAPLLQVQSGNLWTDLNNLINAPNLVIANSTFSWMGGWLGDRERNVTIPDPWFRTQEMDARDLYPENWLKVQHRYE